MIAIGMLLGAVVFFINGKKHSLNFDHQTNLLICVVFFGWGGGKLLSVIVNIPYIIQGTTTIMEALGGGVVYGGIIAAGISTFIYCKRHELNFLEYADLALPCICYAQSLGRVGCFIAGCCHGKEYHGFGAITYTISQIAPNNIPLIPTQLISAVFMFIFGTTMLYVYNKKKLQTGTITCTYFIGYGIARFIIEFFRGDDVRGFIFGMSTSQFISFFIVFAGIMLKVYLNKKLEEE